MRDIRRHFKVDKKLLSDLKIILTTELVAIDKNESLNELKVVQ